MDSERRLHRALTNLLVALCGDSEVLVLLLDDLHFADHASIRWLRYLLSVGETERILVACSSRLEQGHTPESLNALLQAATQRGVLCRVTVPGICDKAIQEMVADALKSDDTELLSARIVAESHGSILHARHLIRAMHAAGDFEPSTEDGSWRWLGASADLPKGLRLEQLLRLGLASLPADTRGLLSIGQLLGARFSLLDLARVSELSMRRIEQVLEPAGAHGWIVHEVDASYFAHDCLQRVVAESLRAEEKRALHTRIARSLCTASELDVHRRIFEVVHHLDRGDGPQTDSEGIGFVELYERAAQRALRSAGFTDGLHYAQRALELQSPLAASCSAASLGSNAATLAYALYVNGDHKAALVAVGRARTHASTLAEQGRVFSLYKDIVISSSGDYDEIIRRGTEILNDTGASFSQQPLTAKDMEQELAEVHKALGSRHPSSLLYAPESSEGDSAVHYRLLMDIWEAAYYAGREYVQAIAVAKMVASSLRFGNAKQAAFGYVLFGAFLAEREQLDVGFSFGQLAMELNYAAERTSLFPKVTNLFCNFLNSYKRPYSTSIDLYEQSVETAMQLGDHLFGLWAAIFAIWTRLIASEDLRTVLTRALELRSFVEQTCDKKMIQVYCLLVQTIEGLMGDVKSSAIQDFSNDAACLYWREEGFRPALTWSAVLTGQVELQKGNYQRAWQIISTDGLELDPQVVMFPITQFHIYRALIAVWYRPEAAASELNKIDDALAEDLALLERWAKSCPDNFLALVHLLHAEKMQLEGEHWHAAALFEDAVATVAPPGLRALVFERAGRFWAAHNRERIAAQLLGEAVRLYRGRHAITKARGLVDQYSEFLHPTMSKRWAWSNASSASREPVVGPIRDSESRDEAWSDDVALLASTLSGASGITVFERRNDQLLVIASLGKSEFLKGDALTIVDEQLDTSSSPVHLCVQERCIVHVKDARNDGRFDDDYRSPNASRQSALCVPHTTQGVVTHVLCLSSDETEAFVALRREGMEMLLRFAARRDTDESVNRAHWLVEQESRVAELALNEERLRLSLEFAKMGVWEWDFARNEVFLSAAFSASLAGEYGLLSAEDFKAAIHPEDLQAVAASSDGCFTGQGFDLEMRVLEQGGHQRWVHATGDVSRNEDGVPVKMLGIIRDIDAEKQASLERESLLGQLEQAEKMKAIGQLTGGIAHDFNNILLVILGNAELAMLQSANVGDPLLADLLGEINRAGTRASQIVGQLLDFGRKENAKTQTIQLSPVVRDILNMLSSTIPASIVVTSRLGEDSLRVNLSEAQVTQILLNCCINARDAMQGVGDLRIVSRMVHVNAVCSSCHLAFAGEYVALEVEDSGCGVSDEIAKRLFEPFFSTKGPTEGTGMGLAMVHGIVHGAGGHILLDSAPGQGSRFQMYFAPVELPGPQAEEPIEAPHRSIARSGKSLRILVVDDEEPVGKVIASVLRRQGWMVDQETDPLEGLRRFDTAPNPYDLVVLDQTMPQLTGLELADRLLGRRPELPIILCTGYSKAMDHDSVTDARIGCVLRKPFESKTLIDAVYALAPEESEIQDSES